MDITYLLYLQNFREATGNMFNSLVAFISYLGEPVIAFLLMAVIYWSVHKKTAIYMMMNFALAGFMNQLLKITFCVYRPWIRAPQIKPVESAMKTATGYSFPSGHVANATSIYGSIAVYFQRHKAKGTAILLVILILLIAFARNYLGVHTPQDVLVSLFVTILLLGLSSFIINWVEAKDNRDFIIFGCAILLVVGLIVYASLKAYPLDYVDGKLLVDPDKMIIDTFFCAGSMAGFFISWILDRRFIHYESEYGTIQDRIFTALLGLFILVPFMYLNTTCFYTFFGSHVGSLLNNISLMVMIMVVYPCIIKAWRIHKKKL